MKTKMQNKPIVPWWYPWNNCELFALQDCLGLKGLRLYPPTQDRLHAMATHIGMKQYWASHTLAQRRARMAGGLLRPDVMAKAEAARRPKLKGPAHRKRVSDGMKKYWRRRHAEETFARLSAYGPGPPTHEQLMASVTELLAKERRR